MRNTKLLLTFLNEKNINTFEKDLKKLVFFNKIITQLVDHRKLKIN